MARFQNKEVYIIAGVAGNKGTVKGEGKIVIPAYTWKVAVIMARDQGLADVHGVGDLHVVAVVMPNEPGIRNVPWQTFEVTVDSVEALSGYDLLALLPDPIENAIESGSSAPVAVVDGPYTAAEGTPVAMSGAGSSDPDGDPFDLRLEFRRRVDRDRRHDVAHLRAGRAVHRAADGHRLPRTGHRGHHHGDDLQRRPGASRALPHTTLVRGDVPMNGSFTDPGQDPWTATVDYGDGAGAMPLALVGRTFTLSHAYARAGSYSVTVVIGPMALPQTRDRHRHRPQQPRRHRRGNRPAASDL